jgi:hypothetical protein
MLESHQAISLPAMSETPQTPLMLLDVDYEEFSYPVATTAEERQGFCDGYVLRRHKHEVLEYDGIREAREDWQRCVGPFRKDIYGSANPCEFYEAFN